MTRIGRVVAIAAMLLALAGGGSAHAAGYNVYVCKAAMDAGYGAPLNRAFGQMYGAPIGGTPGYIQVLDTCNDWLAGSPGSLGLYRQPGVMALDFSGGGGTFAPSGGMWVMGVAPNSGLYITHIQQTSRIVGCEDTCGYPGNAGVHVGFVMNRFNDPPGRAGGDALARLGPFGCFPWDRGVPAGADGDFMFHAARVPGDTCDIAGTWDTDYNIGYKPYQYFMHSLCTWQDPATVPWGCTYDGPIWLAQLSSATVYVTDETDPVVALGPVAVGPPLSDLNGDGTLDPVAEAIPIATASDNSGISRLELQVDGVMVDQRVFSCDHRLLTPCPGATGSDPLAQQPPAANLGPFSYDLNALSVGNHTVRLFAWDAAGRWSYSEVTIPVPPEPQIITEEECRGFGLLNIVSNTPVAGCPTPSSPLSGDPAPNVVDIVKVSGGAAPEPTAAPAVFKYDLAFNAQPDKQPINSGDCKTVHAVVNGSGAGGALSNREMNQIVSVTIDLKAFVTGRELGQHSIKSTYSLPSRDSARYREALGCPG